MSFFEESPPKKPKKERQLEYYKKNNLIGNDKKEEKEEAKEDAVHKKVDEKEEEKILESEKIGYWKEKRLRKQISKRLSQEREAHSENATANPDSLVVNTDSTKETAEITSIQGTVTTTIKEEKNRGQGGRRRKKNRIAAPTAILTPPVPQPPLLIKRVSALNKDCEEEFQLEEFVETLYEELKTKEVNFMPEDDEGDTEYKLKLVRPTAERMEHLATQMKYRLCEGFGKAYYHIGVEDSGIPTGLDQEEMLESLRTVCTLAKIVHAEVVVDKSGQGLRGVVVHLTIVRLCKSGLQMEIRVLLLGESGSGKSTLLGVLKSGERDDGKGYARIKVFTHKHELMTGATQTKSHHVIGFDADGKLYNQKQIVSLQTWIDNANKLLAFIDVGGHKKAEKQLVFSLCSFFPEYALWVVSGKTKFTETNKLELAAIFNLPLIVVITHLDCMTGIEEIETVYETKAILKKMFPDKTPCVIKEMESAVLFSRITSTEDVIPIFVISNVTGANMNIFTSFLNLLTSLSESKAQEVSAPEFSISNIFTIAGKIVLAGTVLKGVIKKGQMLHLGPDSKGSFRAVEVESIQCMRVPVKVAKCGQICTVAIRLLHYSKEWLEKEPNCLRRGMVLVDGKSNPRATYEFLAEFTVYGKEKQERVAITAKYLPVVNTLTARQICNIVSLQEHNPPLELITKKSKSIEHRKKLIKKKRKESLEIRHTTLSNFPYEQHELQNQSHQHQPKIFEKKSQKIFVNYKLDKPFENTETECKEFYEHQTSFQEVKEETNNKEHESENLLPKSINKEETLKNVTFSFTKEEQLKVNTETEINSEKKLHLKSPKVWQEELKKKKEAEEIVFSENEVTSLRLRFKYQPEYLSLGQRLVIYELKLIGKVKEIYY